MKILLDASHQRAGGGLQVSHGILSALTDDAFAEHDWHVLAPEGSTLHPAAAQIAIPSDAYPTSTVGRQTRGRSVVRGVVDTFDPDVAYTVFGPPVPVRAGVTTAAGMAYSNLLYPEVDFWAHLPRRTRWKHEVRDRFRQHAVRQASGLILETEALRRRAIERWGYEEEATTVIRPAVGPNLLDPEEDGRVRNQLNLLPSSATFVLLASGYHPNKNVDQIPAIALEAPELHFVLTVEPGSPGGRELREVSQRLGVSDRVHLIGNVPQVSIGMLYQHADVLLLMSELESFSNNVSEAIATRTPLVLSDRDWARSAAGEAAVYVPPREPSKIAAGLRAALDPVDLDRRLDVGSSILAEHHGTHVGRLRHVVRFLETLRNRS
ncbi:glycosyltransferase [Janibacter melonis]|uniref:glycosyltransferase n=1 Tax=Janibacter melonis TaxID=262209 RepID=UPI00177C4E38|nr:glycosyltransferase [Janibacter melonis]